jgi:hypothetical protein
MEAAVMTLIDTSTVVFDADGRARVPSSTEHRHVRTIRSRPSGASNFRTRLPSPIERALMGTIGRPWV